MRWERKEVQANVLPLLLRAGLAVAAGMGLCGCGPGARPVLDGEGALSLVTSDGFELGGDLYTAAGEKPPGLILVHMLGSDRSHWEPFAQQAKREGYMSVAYDIRGHGESKLHRGEAVSYRSFGDEEWPAAVRDIAAAKEALITAGADPDNLAIVGASIGGNLALTYAEGDRQIQAVVMLSPGLEYKGVEIESVMQGFRERPVLILAAEGDQYSASSGERLKAIARGFCEFRVYPGSAHGTGLFAATDNATGQILLWLDGILKRPPAELP